MKKMYLIRKMNGTLHFFIGGYAVKEGSAWIFKDGAAIMRLDKECFPEVKWEDDEPTEVMLVLKKDQMKEKAIEAFNHAMVFYTSAACPKEEEALELFINLLEND